MKSTLLILGITFSLNICAQTTSYTTYDKISGILDGTNNTDNTSSHKLFPGTVSDTDEFFYLSESERTSFITYNFFIQPPPPLLTTNPADLEICTGNSTRLTAASNYVVSWYTTPPPLGSPVGTGTSYITPPLTTGYYTYYAIAENSGIKSEITGVEVVMVYPSPTLSISSSVNTLCASETATLTVSGTTYYEWENGPISAQMTIRPATTQSYKVTGINTAGCKSTAVYIQTVETCTLPYQADISIDQVANTDQQKDHKLFSVYPNPNNGEFSIRVNSISESTKVEVYNWQGTLTLDYKVTDEVTAVTLKDFPNGIYIIRIIENNKVLKQEKIIKE